MKNKLSDLNNHLFAQLERLGEEGLSAEQIEQEAKRGEAIVAVAEQIVRNADLQLKAVTLLANHGGTVSRHLTMLEAPQQPQQPALAAVPTANWCDQCEARVSPEEAARCKSAHCKAKAAA